MTGTFRSVAARDVTGAATETERSMARVRCIMMQRDERLLLDAWFRYYGHLFGFENLTVFDNGSVDPQVIATLRTYERAGADIRWGHDRHADFLAKHHHVRNVVKYWDAHIDYDFALPLDCDEFLALYTENGITCSRDALHAAFDELIGEQRAIGFTSCLFNMPGHPGGFRAVYFPKSFMARNTLDKIDRGFHAITSRVQEGLRHTDFTYLHMHHKPFALLLEHARRKLRHVAPVDDLEALRHYQGGGLHLVPYFFMTEADYLAQFSTGQFIRFPAFVNQMRALGIVDSFFCTEQPAEPALPRDGAGIVDLRGGEPGRLIPFNAATYLRLNPDVAAAGWPALRHYAECGMTEGRTISDLDPALCEEQALANYEHYCSDSRKTAPATGQFFWNDIPAPRQKEADSLAPCSE